MRKKLAICIAAIAAVTLQGCSKKEDGLTEKSSGSNGDRKVELLRWKKNIDTQYKNCMFVPGREAQCKKEFDEAMVPFLKEQAKGS